MKLPLWRRRREQLDEEIRTHLEMAKEERIHRGESSTEAQQSARCEFGNVALVESVTRDQWRWTWLEDLIEDIRYAARILGKSPGFAAIAITTLALGIGANTAIFSLVDAFLLRLLPVKEPQQLVFIQATRPKGGTRSDFPYSTFEALRSSNHFFSGMFAWDDSLVAVTVDSHPEFIDGDFVSGSYWDVLGVRAFLGRTFTPEDDQPGKKPVVVISYAYWERRFARDPAAIGKTIFLGRIPFTVVGVTSPRFFGRNIAGRSADVVLPMFWQPQLGLKDHDTFKIMARLGSSVTAEQARANLDVAYQQVLLAQAGSQISPQVEQQIRAQRIVLKPGLRGASQPTHNFTTELRILASVVGITLLIASVNVAGLILVRASARQKEIAVRLALGAARERLVRLLLTESVLLAALGGTLGLLFAKWGVGLLLAALSNPYAAIPFELSPNVRILALISAVSLLTGILLGLVPALTATRVELNPVLKGTQGASESRGSHPALMKSLVISQVALSLSLLIGAGLLLRSLKQFYAVDMGFARDNVLQMWVFPTLSGYDHSGEMRLYRELLEKLNATPGVRSASLSRLRMIFGRWYRDVWVEGTTPDALETRQVYCDPVGPRFFETMGVPLLLGREFSVADTETSPKVAIVSESMARKFFPEENPVGRHFGFDAAISSGDIEIVGVVKDVRHHLEDQQPREAAWIPYTQAPLDMYGQMNFVLRTTFGPASVTSTVQSEVQSVDKNLPLVGVETQTAEIDEYLGDQRSMAALLGFFAALALVLASIGLYGTMSYAVARRTKELGVRLALGAPRNAVLWMVLRETLSLVAVGVVIGVPLALGATRLISSLLFGVRATDPVTISIAISVMCAVALFAGYIPARRAMRVDPIAALRYE